MTFPQALHSPAITLITPECDAPGCSISGDQYTMVHCGGCGGWFCPEHIAAQEGVTLVRPAPRALRHLAYYQGLCGPCQREQPRTHH
jgi:hypothetical protein